MAVEAITKGVKLTLKLGKGSQTISECNMEATNEQLFSLAGAVAKLEKEEMSTVTKVIESTLIGE